MKIPKLTYSTEECINKIKSVCDRSNIIIKRDNKIGHTILNLASSDNRYGMIRIYDSKSGRTLDGSQKDISLNDVVLEEFKEINCSNNNGSIVDKTAVYKVIIKDLDRIKSIIEKVASKNSYHITGNLSRQSTIYYLIKVVGSDQNDNITITQYNSGTLLIQGKGWQTWEEICVSIEQDLASPVKEVLVRYMADEKTNISNIITDDLIENAEKQVSERLDSAYTFLYDHDKKLIISSQAQLLAGINYGDFFCYVAPALKVIEGYLIKIIVELGLITLTKILEVKPSGIPNFNFSQVFGKTADSDLALLSKFKCLLKDGNSTINEKEIALLNIHDKFRWTRSPYLHDGPPPIEEVSSYDDAESIYDEIIDMIRETYKTLLD